MQVEAWNPQQDGPLVEAALRRKLEALGYRVQRYVYAPGTVFPSHQHAVDKIDAVVAGKFALHMHGRRHILQPGEWIPIPRGVEHSAAVIGDEPVISLDAVRSE